MQCFFRASFIIKVSPRHIVEVPERAPVEKSRLCDVAFSIDFVAFFIQVIAAAAVSISVFRELLYPPEIQSGRNIHVFGIMFVQRFVVAGEYRLLSELQVVLEVFFLSLYSI